MNTVSDNQWQSGKLNRAPKVKYDEILFFGRGLREYVRMFNLDLFAMTGQSILDVAAGPATFALEAKNYGIAVTACDPMYAFDIEVLTQEIEHSTELVESRRAAAKDLFDSSQGQPEHCRQYMNSFLNDYNAGRREQRYVCGYLPKLPFADEAFDTVLCGNLLFVYADTKYGGTIDNSQLDYKFHLNALLEMLRVTRHDVRIYPLTGPEPSGEAAARAIIYGLEQHGVQWEIIRVENVDMKDANHMLRLIKDH